jgi:hypothetical protein
MRRTINAFWSMLSVSGVALQAPALAESERLTWGGVALHAGGLPGYPESHGCIHLPSEFARQLFQISPSGMTVVLAPKKLSQNGSRIQGISLR